jgi:hypothetical protein
VIAALRTAIADWTRSRTSSTDRYDRHGADPTREAGTELKILSMASLMAEAIRRIHVGSR